MLFFWIHLTTTTSYFAFPPLKQVLRDKGILPSERPPKYIVGKAKDGQITSF